MLEKLIIIGHLVVSIAIVGMVLIQQGKGAEAGASFGSGASATVFGAQGTGTFFSRVTAILAAIFFATSLGLAYYAKQRAKDADDFGLPSAAAVEVQKKEVAVPELEQQEEMPAPGESEGRNDSIPELE